jgi:hypothetical protein
MAVALQVDGGTHAGQHAVSADYREPTAERFLPLSQPALWTGPHSQLLSWYLSFCVGLIGPWAI